VSSAELIDRWHDFYLLAGTAAVTLVGLLFVALSLHLDVLIRGHHDHLLTYARQTLLSFSFVLLISLLFLVPLSGPRILGATALVTSLVAGVVTVRLARAGMAAGDGPGQALAPMLRRRTLILLSGYLVTVVCGAVMMLRRDPFFAHWMVGGVCMLLGNALGSSWDLLVLVGRLKSELEESREIGPPAG
jgi:hypothetical protein